MATKLKEGDLVQVVDREVTAADEKNRTYFDHFRNISGSLEKLYDDGLASVVVDAQSLPEEVLRRHEELTETARNKWLDGLSGEARAKLTQEEQQFQMRYTILVNLDDLQPAGQAPKASKKPAAKKTASKATDTPAAISSSDLDKAEEEFLRQKQSKKSE